RGRPRRRRRRFRRGGLYPPLQGLPGPPRRGLGVHGAGHRREPPGDDPRDRLRRGPGAAEGPRPRSRYWQAEDRGLRQGPPGAHGGGRPGKLLNFLYLLGRHPEEVEADLAAEYGGLDLVYLWRGRITARRLSVLTVQLPSGSRVWKATGGAQAWSDEVSTLMILDLRLRELCWAETEDGQKGRNAPAIVSPPQFED